MFKLVPFQLEHIKPLLAEPLNACNPEWVKDDYDLPRKLSQQTGSATGMVGDEVVFCAFIIEIWKGRAYLVTILSQKIFKYSLKVYRALKKLMPRQPYDRLEMDVPVDMEIAHRRARFLGFELQIARAKKYLPDGSDASIYAWVRE